MNTMVGQDWLPPLVVDFIRPYYVVFLQALPREPHHIIIESLLGIFIVWLLFIRQTVNPKLASNNKLTTKEQDWLIETWTPEPLIPTVRPVDLIIVDKVEGNYITVRDIKGKVLNLNSFDFLGFSRIPQVKIAARSALEKYGCGSCGPRGFYGTIDLHLEFEKQIAAFMGCEEAISYSDSASAVASSIPAFAKKGDLLLVDEAVCEPILTALALSRSTVYFFKHNDMGDLRNILSSIADDDVRLRRDTLQQRRFIVVEGLYRNTGAVCPLTELIALKAEFFYRLVVDETLSFGVLGPHGKGVTDLFGAAVTDVDILTVAMDTVLASVGGVCLGNREVVDHQRLAGAGYCFSASAPPFLSAVAISTLNELRDDPTAVQKLHQVISSATAALDGIKGLKRICYTPDIPTPVVHFVLETQLDFVEEEVLLARLAGALLQKGIAVSATKLPRDAIKRLAAAGHRPTLRLSLNSTLSSSDVNKAVSALQAGIDEVIFGKKSDWLFSYSP